MMNFIRRVPDGATLTLETLMRSVLPINTMAIAMGLHTRCGNEDTLWGRKGEKFTSVQQVEQLVRIATELGREVATGKEARDIYRIGEYLRQRRRDPGQARLRAQPQARPGRLHLPRLSTLPEPPITWAPTRSVEARVRVHRTPRPHRCTAGPLPRPRVRTSTTSHWSTMTPHRRRRHASRRPSLRHRPPAAHPSRLFPWLVFALTFGLLLSDYMSRQVLSAVFPFLKVEWTLTDTQLGGADQHRGPDRRPARRAAVAAGRPLGPLEGHRR